MSNSNLLSEFLATNSWEQVAQLEIDGREPRFQALDADRFSHTLVDYVRSAYPGGMYLHQSEGLNRFAAGEHVCLATGTSSGKTTLFHGAAIETIAQDPAAKVICLYPLKALANEQEERWIEVLKTALPQHTVGRISGDVKGMPRRVEILRESSVLVLTPDVLHAWLLPNCDNRHVNSFLKQLRMVVLDEAHAYKGVFGSNTAMLIRRLRHLCSVTGNAPRFVSASATIHNPDQHLKLLTGVEFSIVGEEFNGARRYPTTIRLLNPPKTGDSLNHLAALIQHDLERRIIAFVDSRKQVEQITSITSRNQAEFERLLSKDSDDDAYGYETSLDFLQRLSILPYRSGYEEEDRSHIQRRLSAGDLRGVISTSALELGIDVPFLDTAILVGAPASSTSFWQRIGRVGRHKPGEVLVVNGGSPYDSVIFADPPSLLQRPPAESALYLQNRRIQYIHALCLARLGGEHDKLTGSLGEDASFSSPIEFPTGFLELCERERTGQIPADLQQMKGEAGETPNHTFPLRDVEQSFAVLLKHGPNQARLGSMTYSQCLREAYPGAVYRYATRPHRVYKVNLRSREIFVRPEKGYFTKPSVLPALVFPNLTAGNIEAVVEVGGLVALETNLQIREWIGGFSERRGMAEFSVKYPYLNTQAGFFFEQSSFARNYFTSGLVLFHPCFQNPGVNRELLAQLLLDSFMYVIPYETSDISFATDKLRTNWAEFKKDTRFLSIYDSTYGSLHLTGRLLEPEVLIGALTKLADVASYAVIDPATQEAVDELTSLASVTPVSRHVDGTSAGESESDKLTVILPGSRGAHQAHDNQEYLVANMFWNPKENGLFYRGRLEHMPLDVQLLTPIEQIVPIPGVSELGVYDPETGELVAQPRL